MYVHVCRGGLRISRVCYFKRSLAVQGGQELKQVAGLKGYFRM